MADRQNLNIHLKTWRARRCGLGVPNLPAAKAENLTATSAQWCRFGIPDFPAAMAENMANCTTSSATHCRSNPVSGRRLPKTGIFQRTARDFQRFRPIIRQIRSLETVRKIAKARHWRAFLQFSEVNSETPRLPGWGGRIRTSAWGNQNPLPYHLATPQLT